MDELRKFLLQAIAEESRSPTAKAVARFGTSRRTVINRLEELVGEGVVQATGRTKARRYTLKTLVEKEWSRSIEPGNAGTAEHEAWKETVGAELNDVPENIRTICQHGFTEMFNNAIDHSGSTKAQVHLTKSAAKVEIGIRDFGVGIFEKIRAARGFSDPREALLDLGKGRFTTDPKNHSGQGIFFTSRMFDEFTLASGELILSAKKGDDDWLFESKSGSAINGTHVLMAVSIFSETTTAEVFDRFSDPELGGFNKTHVPVTLARYDQDKLVSRSQAKRVLARFEKFREVMLDFEGVDTIGQAFADEIFRVFAQQHPEVVLLHINASPAVEKMIAWVRGDQGMQGPLL